MKCIHVLGCFCQAQIRYIGRDTRMRCQRSYGCPHLGWLHTSSRVQVGFPTVFTSRNKQTLYIKLPKTGFAAVRWITRTFVSSYPGLDDNRFRIFTSTKWMKPLNLVVSSRLYIQQVSSFLLVLLFNLQPYFICCFKVIKIVWQRDAFGSAMKEP